jgi:exportin-1
MRNVADTGLNILYQLLQNVASQPDAAQSFYQTYYTDILQHMFSVVTDTSHTAGLTMHATILAYMFTLVETNKITVYLNPVVSTVPLPGANITYVQVMARTGKIHFKR